MPGKNTKGSKINKKSSDLSNQLMFNINPNANPNGLVDPILSNVSNTEKLGSLLNGITQNSFNDGIDTTISNTASLLNNQISEAVNADPGFFNENNIKKVLHYLVEPTFNKLNNMANNTQYNYNQFAGVINEKSMNKNINLEQEGGFGFYPYARRRQVSPLMTLGRQQRIVPRMGYAFQNRSLFNYFVPKTMIVPSMTIVTHDQITDATDRRERSIFDNYVTHTHSISAGDSNVRIRDHPSFPNDHEVIVDEDLKNNFYKVTGNGNHSSITEIVYGFNLFKNGAHAPIFDTAYRQMLDRISFRFKSNAKHHADKLKYKDIDANDGRDAASKGGDFVGMVGDIKHGYFQMDNKHYSVLRIDKKI